MRRFALLCLFFAQGLLAAEAPCPQLNPENKDADGVMFCPLEVKANTVWAVYRCAIEQANSFRAPTPLEKKNMSLMLEGWQYAKTDQLLKAAEALNLQVCRVSQYYQAQKDTYLVIYVKPGVRDYTGPFFMLRETRHSKVLIIGPHDDTDGTWNDTKLATSLTLSMGTISNGHQRSKVRKEGDPKGYADFVHTPGGSNADLGTYAVEKICNLNAASVVFHVHGMRDQTKVMYRARNNKVLEQAYEATVKANTSITEFVPLNADFTIDPLVNTSWYIKTEIPSGIHRNDQSALARMVTDFEKNSWAWPAP